MASILDEFLIIFKPQVQGTGLQKLDRGLRQTQQSLKRTQGSLVQTQKSLFNIKDLFRSFVAYDLYSGAKAVLGSLVQASQDLGAMESRFFAITKSNELANKELEWTLELARRTAMPLKETADSYSIFYAAVQKSLGTGGAREVFQDWTEVSRVLHLSTNQFERVTYALREMASKGAIYSQDLRMQIGTHVPNAMGLARKAAEQLGFTGNNWFENFQKAAKGNQQLINQFILLFSRAAKETYASSDALAEALKKPDALLKSLSNKVYDLKLAVVKGGFEKDLVSFLKVANALLGSMVKHAGGLYKVIKLILGAFLAFGAIKGLGALSNLIGNFAMLGSLAKGAKSIKGLTSLGGAVAGTAGISGIGSAIGGIATMLTNPVGQIALAIGLLVLVIPPFIRWFKKTFPNAYDAISNRLIIFKNFVVGAFDTVKSFLSAILKKLGVAVGEDGRVISREEARRKFQEAGGFYRGYNWRDGLSLYAPDYKGGTSGIKIWGAPQSTPYDVLLKGGAIQNSPLNLILNLHNKIDGTKPESSQSINLGIKGGSNGSNNGNIARTIFSKPK